MKKLYFLKLAMLAFIFLITAQKTLKSQINDSPATAIVINSFPHTEYNVNTSDGGTAIGMNGSCYAIACCSTYVYRVEVPTYGSLRVENDNYVPLGGSIIAYTPDIDNPVDWSDLTYYSGSPGNFCGYRDTLQLGYGYNWSSGEWRDFPIIDSVVAPGVYYLLIFNHNNQVGIGDVSNFTFQFESYCPDGYSCSNQTISMCDGEGYTSPSGNIYTSSGSYTDTLFGAANGGLDSLIFTNLTIYNTHYLIDSISDETVCVGTDTIKHIANSNYVSMAEFSAADHKWINANNVVPSIAETNRSVFGWMYKSTTVSSTTQVLVGINSGSGGNICNLQIGTNEKLGVYDGANSRYSSSVVTDGQWHHVGYTYDETTDTLKLYVDGEMVLKFKNGQTVTATSQLSLGQEFDNSSKGNFYDGIFTEVSIWNEVLDSTDIADIRTESISNTHPKYSNLMAYYTMYNSCQVSDLIVTDLSSNSNDALASHSGIQLYDTLGVIDGYNTLNQFDIEWKNGSTFLSSSDTLMLTSFSSGTYSLTLERDYFTISDDWVVTTCGGGGCTPTYSTINPYECVSYTSPSGNYTWTTSGTYSDTIQNIAGCDSIITINLSINVSDLNASINIDSTVNCFNGNDGGMTAQASGGTSPYSYLWNNSASTPTIAGINAATYYVTITDANGCTSSDTSTMTQPDEFMANIVIDSVPTCYGYNDGGLTVQASGGVSPYSYLWNNTATTPTIAGVSAGTYYATLYDSHGCISSDTNTLTQADEIIADIIIDSLPSCYGENDGGLTAQATGGVTPYSYLWNNTGTTPTLTGLGAGNYNVTITDSDGCEANKAEILTQPDEITSTDVVVACDSLVWVDGITYTSNNNTATYTYTSVSGCDSVVNLDLTINNSVVYNAPDVIACDSAQINGNWYSVSQTVTDVFAGATINGCDSTVITILTIQSPPTSNAGADATICEDETYETAGSASEYQSLVWTTSGDGSFVNANSLNATYTPGFNDIGSASVELILTATANSPCAVDASDTLTLTIQQLPNSNAGNDDIICESSTFSLNGIAANYDNLLWTSSGDGSFDDATILNPVYTPGSNDINNGNVYLILSANSVSPCINSAIDSLLLSIQYLAQADAGSDATICESDTYTLNGMASYQQTVLWSTNGDGSFDDASLLSATYTPGSNDINNESVTLQLTAYSLAPCGDEIIDEMHITIQPAPTSYAGDDAVICENQTYALNPAAENYSSVLWTSSGDGSFDDASILNAVYTPGANDILNGELILSLTSYAITPCVPEVTDNMNLEIQLLPTVNAGTDALICEAESFNVTATAENYSSLLWTSSGDGTFDNTTSLNAVYTPGTNDILNGSVDLQLTAYSVSPCVPEISDIITLNIQSWPESNAGEDAEICQSDSFITSGGASEYQNVIWETLGDGVFNDPTLLNATYFPGELDIELGGVTLSLTAYSLAPCSVDAYDEMYLSINKNATANAGNDITICEDETANINGEANYNDGVLWTTSGDGAFDNPNLLNAGYTPGLSDIGIGNVTLTLTSFANNGCGGDASDDLLLSISKFPTQPDLPVGPTTIDLDFITESEYSTTIVENADDYNWSLIPLDAGIVSSNENTATINWNSDFTGLIAELSVEVSNEYCGSITSDILEIGISPVGIINHLEKQLEVKISPNPSSGKFILTVEGAGEEIHLLIIDSNGKIIKQEKLLNTKNEFTTNIDISMHPAGNYYIKIITDQSVTTKKININDLFR